MVDEGLLVLVGADDPGAMVALELVHQPGADRVHPVDLGQVDDQPLGADILELLAELADPEQGEVAAEAQHGASVFLVQDQVGGGAHSGEVEHNPL